MTATDERIDRIEHRVDNLEKTLAADIRTILSKLNEMEITGVKNACPNPGACITLGLQLESAIIAHNATMQRVERLELSILKLMQERAYVLGGCAVVATVFSFIGVGLGMLFTWILQKP